MGCGGNFGNLYGSGVNGIFSIRNADWSINSAGKSSWVGTDDDFAKDITEIISYYS